MKKIIIALSILLPSIHSFSQTKDAKSAINLKKQVLLVALEEENPKIVKKLSKKKEELEFYKNQIEGNNTALKNAVENYWKYSSSVEFKPYSEALKMRDENKEKYALMSYFKYVEYDQYNSTGAGWNRNGGGFSYNPGTHYSEAVNTITQITLTLSDTKLTACLPTLYVSKADAVYGVQQLQYVVSTLQKDENATLKTVYSKDIPKNGFELKNKTLLFDKEDLDKGLTESTIKKIYPYPFKIVSMQEIEKAILNKEPGIAYVMITASPGAKGNIFIHYITDAEGGKILGMEYPKVGFGITGLNGVITYNQRIKEKQLEKYADIVNGK